MATQVSMDVPSFDRVAPGSFPLSLATFPAVASPPPSDPQKVVELWLLSFNDALRNPSFDISEIFFPESYWRDQLCLSWDFRCLKGPDEIASLLRKSKSGCRMSSAALDNSSHLRSPTVAPFTDTVCSVQAFLTVETDVGTGKGIVRLVQDDKAWKAFTLFTFLEGLTGYEEAIRWRRPNGVEHGEHSSRKTWLDRRDEEENFRGREEPTVLIVGSGQAGLTVAARLKMLGIKCLIIDREKRVGDNWRRRYNQLVLHDPVWFDHLPYIPFPENWPVFTPKDKFGDWLESYVRNMELNVWTQTNVVESSWDEATGKWTVTLERIKDETTESRVLHPKHIIQATGHSGMANFPSHINGISSFKGFRLVHGSQFPGAIPSHGQNKKAIVIGCGTSAHDIAQDFYENGYSTTMVQRSSTLVISSENLSSALSALYSEDGPPILDADMLYHSTANPVTKRINISLTKAQNKVDEQLLNGLEKVGFKINMGPDNSGLWITYLQHGGGYYIDVGCSQLIIDGKIKIKQGQEIAEILPHGVKFADGEVLEADEIVFATGYQNMRTQCRNIFGDELANKVHDIWGFDKEGELRTVWRNSGHPGFWFAGGNLSLCRWFSRLLALQIKGLEEGLYKHDNL